MHLKSIFIAGTSWKVTQVKTKFTLLTFVRSEEGDSLGLVLLNISLFVHLLWGLPKRFLLLGRTLVSNWGLRSNVKVQVFAPHNRLRDKVWFKLLTSQLGTLKMLIHLIVIGSMHGMVCPHDLCRLRSRMIYHFWLKHYLHEPEGGIQKNTMLIKRWEL